MHVVPSILVAFLAGLHLMNRLLGATITGVCNIWLLSNNSIYSPGKKSGGSGFPKHPQSSQFSELPRSFAVGEALSRSLGGLWELILESLALIPELLQP